MHFPLAKNALCIALLAEAKNGENDFHKVYLTVLLFLFFLPPIPIAVQECSLENKNKQATNMVQSSASYVNEVTMH